MRKSIWCIHPHTSQGKKDSLLLKVRNLPLSPHKLANWSNRVTTAYMNVIESILNVGFLFASWKRSPVAILVGFSAVIMTAAKTILYWLIDQVRQYSLLVILQERGSEDSRGRRTDGFRNSVKWIAIGLGSYVSLAIPLTLLSPTSHAGSVSHSDVSDTDAAVSRSVAVTTPLEIGGSSLHSRMDSGSSYRKSTPWPLSLSLRVELTRRSCVIGSHWVSSLDSKLRNRSE